MVFKTQPICNTIKLLSPPWAAPRADRPSLTVLSSNSKYTQYIQNIFRRLVLIYAQNNMLFQGLIRRKQKSSAAERYKDHLCAENSEYSLGRRQRKEAQKFIIREDVLSNLAQFVVRLASLTSWKFQREWDTESIYFYCGEGSVGKAE